MPDTASTEEPSTSSTNARPNIIHRNLSIKPFVKQSDCNENAVQWQRYKRNIGRQFRFFGITDAEVKKDGLLIYGGDDLVDIDEALPDPEQQDGDDVYAILIRKFDQHFIPKQNKDFARFQMNELKQHENERLADYYARVRDIAKKCQYGDHENEAIRDHLIRTMVNDKLRAKAIRENWPLDRMLTDAALDEQTTEQATIISQKLVSQQPRSEVKKVETRKPRHMSKSINCGRCGNAASHPRCPAQGATCNNCGGPNHFARMCRNHRDKQTDSKREYKQDNHRRSWNPRNPNDNKQDRKPWNPRKPHDYARNKPQRSRARYVECQENNNSTSDSSNEDDSQLYQHFRSRYITHDQGKPHNDNNDGNNSPDERNTTQTLKTHHVGSKTGKLCTVQINGVHIKAEPDTGSDSNIMDEFQFKELQRQTPETKIKASRIKLKTLKADLPVLGESDVTISNETRKVQTTIVIIQGKIDSPPLICRQTLEDLGMICFDHTGGLKEPNNNIVKNIKQPEMNTELPQIIERYTERFSGIGKATRDGKEIQIAVPMKDDAIPIAQKPRRVPYHLVEPLKQQLDEFVQNDIIEQVPEHEAITWCSPLVVQPKPKNPKAIRTCLDLRLVNQSMLRTRQVQAPITEDFIREFRDCKIFSKLDLNHGYHQFALTEESRRIMTFSTPWGNYRYKRLAFGGLNSQDLFDAEIAKLISGIPHVLNNRDDIMIGGTDWKDHNRSLQALLQRIEDHNLTLRREKCEFGKTTLTFHGHMFTAEGLKPSPEKTKAVRECSPPQSKEELISFLQILAYLSRYISNFSKRCDPLRRITRDKVPFIWTDEQQQAFDDLKNAITSAPVLIPFFPQRETLVICDGSPTGLGGGLFQKTQHGYQPVHYISRTLTDTEKRYSQIEREALSAEFATSRLSMYLLGGKHFQLATDHKPLLPLFNKPQAKLPPRIERIIMKMQNMDFTMIHIPGKQNMTDYMSRHALHETTHSNPERQIKAIIQADHAVVLETIAHESEKDQELQHLRKTIHSGKWDKTDPILKPYIDIQAELYEVDNVILRLDRIVPPANLRDKIIRIAHKQGHLGLSKTKEMIRYKYWWPQMNLQIENAVKKCFECQISTTTKTTEPAKMTELPAQTWETVEIDFCGPFPNGEYALVVTDQYSRYPEVEFTTTTSFTSTRSKLKKIFSTHGVPVTVQTDNGPPFNSHDFTEFSKEMGFYHKRITPLHPKAQGQVENFNKLINKTMTIARQQGTKPREAVYDMLQAYRSTPHPATKATPYQLLMNRDVRTILDHAPILTNNDDRTIRENDLRYKQKSKAYHDQRNKAKHHTIKLGDAVLVKRENKRKAQTPYEPYIYIVTQVKGSQIEGKRMKDGRVITRDASKFKVTQLENKQEPMTTQQPQYLRIPNVETTHNSGPDHHISQPQDTAPQPTPPSPVTTPAVSRRSERARKSIFDGKLKDYNK